MASIFLVNDNKIVSRLLQLSSEKHGYLLEEKMEIEPSREHYDFVLIDSDKYSPETIEELKSKVTFGKLGYIGVKKETVPPEFDMHLDKPFLPSDFVSMIEENMHTTQEEETVLSEEVDLENETLSMEVEETQKEPTAEEKLETTEETIDLDTEEELEALKELEDFEELEDFSLDELDTPEEAPKTETAEEGALKDIEKTEDALKELDALDEELEDLDLSLDSGAVMSTGIAEQYLEEPAEVQTEEKTETHEETKEPDEPSDEASNVAIGAAVSAAAAAGAAMLHEEEEEKHEKPLQKPEEELSNLDTLEGSEALEHESDYLEEEITAEELANEFDTLNEEEVMKALNTGEEAAEPSSEPEPQTDGETLHETVPETVAEEIIHEEIVPEGEETLVESNDVEKWIRDAVAKAITPEMIKEALDGMEINVTLNFTKKES